MSEAGRKVVDPLLRLDGEDTNNTLDILNILDDLLHQPQAHISGDLIVPAPSRVELSSNIAADNLGQAALVSGVDVLIILLDVEGVVLPLGLDGIESTTDLGELVGGENGRVGLGEGEGVGLGAGNVDGVELLVVGEALVELPHAVRREMLEVSSSGSALRRVEKLRKEGEGRGML